MAGLLGFLLDGLRIPITSFPHFTGVFVRMKDEFVIVIFSSHLEKTQCRAVYRYNRINSRCGLSAKRAELAIMGLYGQNSSALSLTQTHQLNQISPTLFKSRGQATACARTSILPATIFETDWHSDFYGRRKPSPGDAVERKPRRHEVM